MDFVRAGDRIRESRKLKGMTQEGLAKAANLSTMSVRRYESGQREATLDIFITIAGVLGVDVNWLMHGQTLAERDKKRLDRVRLAKLAAQTQNAYKALGYKFESAADGKHVIITDTDGEASTLNADGEQTYYKETAEPLRSYADYLHKRAIKKAKAVEDADSND